MKQGIQQLLLSILLLTFLFYQVNLAQSNAIPIIINNNIQHNSYKQTNCNIFPDSSKGFIATWDDYRFGGVHRYAQKFDSNSNKVGNEFKINNYNLISYSSTGSSFGIYDSTYSYAYFPWVDHTVKSFMGEVFNTQFNDRPIYLGGGEYPECGTGWPGEGYSISRYNNDCIVVSDFGGSYWLTKIYSDGSDSLLSMNGEGEYNISSTNIAVNSRGDYNLLYFNGGSYDSTAGFYAKTFSSNDSLVSTSIIESFADRKEQAIWDFQKDINSFFVNDTSFQVMLMDSLMLKIYVVDINGNVLTKNSYPIFYPEIYSDDSYYEFQNFTVSNFNSNSKSLLVSIYNYNFEKNYNTLLHFDRNGEIIGEPIFDSTFTYRLGDEFYKDENNYLVFAESVGNKAYLMRYNNFTFVDSSLISSTLANSNEVKPTIKKYKNDKFHISYSNELGINGRIISNDGSPYSDEIKIDSKEHQFFNDGTSIVFWNTELSNYKLSAGFTIYDDSYIPLKSDTLVANINYAYAFCYGKIAPSGDFHTVHQGINGVFLSQYSKSGELLDSVTISAESLQYRTGAKIFYKKSKLFVVWNNTIYSVDESMNITNISANIIHGNIFACWNENEFATLINYSNVDGAYYTLLDSNGDTLLPSITIGENNDFMIASVAKNDEFILLTKNSDEIYTTTYNRLGQKTVDEFVVHKIENEIIKDVTFAINGDKILFTWSGKKIGDFDYDIYAVSYSLGLLTDVELNNKNNVVTKFELSQNYPNPFNPSTTIKYSIPVEIFRGISSQMVTLRVFDILGREVVTLVNENQMPGNYEVKFDASELTSGVYFYKITSGEFSDSKKMVLLR